MATLENQTAINIDKRIRDRLRKYKDTGETWDSLLDEMIDIIEQKRKELGLPIL